MQQIFEANDILEASIVKGLLEQCGIKTALNGYYLQGGIGELPLSGLASLWVEDEDAIAARRIVEDYLSGSSQADSSAGE